MAPLGGALEPEPDVCCCPRPLAAFMRLVLLEPFNLCAAKWVLWLIRVASRFLWRLVALAACSLPTCRSVCDR